MPTPHDLRTAASHAGFGPYPSFSIHSLRDQLGSPQGDVILDFTPYPLRILTYNTAFIMAKYQGHDEDKAAVTFVNNLLRLPADIVGLCELFQAPLFPGFSDFFIRNLKEVYPYYEKGPDQGELSDSGLLLFSRHPITAVNKMVYTAVHGNLDSADGFASKGAIHAEITVPNIGPVDVFLTHAQSTSSDTSGEWDELLTQMDDLGLFWQAYADRNRPSFLMGDFNIADSHPSYAADMIPSLGHPIDLWDVNRPHDGGVTFDNGNSFRGYPRHNARIGRLDYIFMKPGRNLVPMVSSVEMVQWEDEDGFDVSDHYGVYAVFDQGLRLQTQVSGGINSVQVKILGFTPIHLHPDLRDTLDEFGLIFDASSQFSTLHQSTLYRNFSGAGFHDLGGPNAKFGSNLDPGDSLDIELGGSFTLHGIPGSSGFQSNHLILDREDMLHDQGKTIKRVLPVESSHFDLTLAVELEIKIG